MEHNEEGALKYQHKNWSPSEIDNLSKKKVHQIILRKIRKNQYTFHALSEKEQIIIKGIACTKESIISAKFVRKFGPSEQICGFRKSHLARVIEEND